MNDRARFVIFYSDYRKAFDTVVHRRLFHRQKQMALPSKLCKWIEDFLRDREMRVTVGKGYSSLVDVLSGVGYCGAQC
jgi:hypothetical protein